MSQRPVATVVYGADGHDGPGWYYWTEDLPEGCTGAFASEHDAFSDARERGYEPAFESGTGAEDA